MYIALLVFKGLYKNEITSAYNVSVRLKTETETCTKPYSESVAELELVIRYFGGSVLCSNC